MTDTSEGIPVIIKRIKKHRHKPHGGAWKVAFADFAIAMMAFFLVLWLSGNSTQEQKQAMSAYFEDPVGFSNTGSTFVIDMGGAALIKENGESSEKDEDANDLHRIDTQEELATVIEADTIESLAEQIERQRFNELLSTLKERIETSKELADYKDQILMSVTGDGLQIQILDKKSRPMFSSGSSRIKAYTYLILRELAVTISSVPNKISIAGHTDAIEFGNRRNFTNWELSSERANAARRALVKSGLSSGKVAEVVGLSSSVLLDKENPENPINRRITILILSQKSEDNISRRASGKAFETDEVRALSEPDTSIETRIQAPANSAEKQLDQQTTQRSGVRLENKRDGWKKILPRGESNTTVNEEASNESDELF